MTDREYSPPTKSFSCTIPVKSQDLKIDDDFDDKGELVRFQIAYGSVYRLEYFQGDAHPLARVDRSASTITQLRNFKENVLSIYSAGPQIKSAGRVLEAEIALDSSEGYLTIIRYTLEPGPMLRNEGFYSSVFEIGWP